LGVGLVSGSGLLLSIVEVVHIQRMETPLGIVLEAVLPLLLAMVLIGVGLWLWVSPFNDASVLRVAGWLLFSMALLGIVFLWIFSHQFIRGEPFRHYRFILANNLSVGGVIGVVLGLYDARSRQYRHRIKQERANLADEQDKLAFLNRMLRHHVLNGMNIITGHTDSLTEFTETEGREHLTVIQEQCDDIIEFVQELRTLTSTLVEDTELYSRDLSAVLSQRIAAIQRAHEHVTVTADIPDGVSVAADELLEQVIENLLTNAIRHADTNSPEVVVTVAEATETVTVRVADNGPGIPDDRKDAVFEWETKGEERQGMGIGLAIVDTLVDRYGGEVWFENNAPTGTVAVVELPRAAATCASAVGE
jgi:signal transduction histidine kinase